MWKAAILLLTLHSCGINGGNMYRNEWAQERREPVSQPSYYSQYGPLLRDLASFQQKLNQQGLTHEQEFSYHHKPTVPEYPVNINQQTYVPSFYVRPTHEPKINSDELKGKLELDNIVKITDKKNESEHAKKPTLEIDIKWPNIKHDTQTDKKHANSTIVQNLNETFNKISDQVEVKVTAIKQFLDKSVDNINKTADGVYQQIGNESSKLIDKINKKLKSIEKQLEKLKFGSFKRNDSDDEFEDDEDLEENEMLSIIRGKPKPLPNVVHSEIGQRLRSLELLDLNAELRGDLKTSISDAVKKAQERFNKLIDEQVSKINSKISDITEKFEAAFNKFQDAFAKLPHPTLKPFPTKVYTSTTTKKPTTTTVRPTTTTTKKYTSINWKPKSTTAIPKYPVKFFDAFTTPDYFKYTLPTPKYKLVASNKNTNVNRIDVNVDALKVVDDARDDLTEIDDDSLNVGEVKPPAPAVNQQDIKKENDEEEEKSSKPIDELKIEFDTAKSLDDLQSQVLENVKDTLKSDAGEALEAIENNQSEALENPEDKLESDTVEKLIDLVFTEELRNETNKDKLLANDDENSNIDNSQTENLDDSTKLLDVLEQDVENGNVKATETSDDSVKMLEVNENDPIDVDDSDMVFVDDEEIPDGGFDSIEDSQLNEPNQAGSFRFDELEVIQLIPVIIEQLRKGHVSESEQKALEKIFGDLWSLLLIEAKRVEGEEMNPLLRTLIQSEEVRLAKREITKQIGNDIYKNSIRRVYRGNDEKAKPYISLDDDRKLLSPSERLLKMVAVIVHKANVLERSEAKLRQKQKRRNMRKKNQRNPLGIVTVEKPRQRFMDRILNINRIKRSIIKFTSDLTDMKALLEQVNQANNSEEDDEIDDKTDERDSREHQDDYLDDDYFYDDDYQMPSDDAGQFNHLGWNQKSYYDDYENGSVNEFIQLAKQRDRREESGTSEPADDSYEDEDY